MSDLNDNLDTLRDQLNAATAILWRHVIDICCFAALAVSVLAITITISILVGGE